MHAAALEKQEVAREVRFHVGDEFRISYAVSLDIMSIENDFTFNGNDHNSMLILSSVRVYEYFLKFFPSSLFQYLIYRGDQSSN